MFQVIQETFRPPESEGAIEGIAHFMERPRLSDEAALRPLLPRYVAERLAEDSAILKMEPESPRLPPTPTLNLTLSFTLTLTPILTLTLTLTLASPSPSPVLVLETQSLTLSTLSMKSELLTRT